MSTKQPEWHVDVRRDGVQVRRDWRGRRKPDGFVGELFEGPRTYGYVFGETESEVTAQALERKAEILAERERQVNVKRVTLL